MKLFLTKLLLFNAIVLLLLAIPFNVTYGQAVPGSNSAVIAGPVSVEGDFSIHIGYAHYTLGAYFVGSAQFGSAAEVQLEAIRLYKISGSFYGGLVAGGGIDYSDRPETGGIPIEELVFGAAGVAITYGFSDKLGSWAFYKSRTDSKPKLGLGLYYQI